MDEDRFQQELLKIKSNKRKKVFFILFGLALFISIVVLSEFKTELSKSENNHFNFTHLDSTQIKNKIDSLTREIESTIKKNFIVVTDEFTKRTRYQSKDYSEYIDYRPLLEVTVYDDGKHYLETNYTAKDWLFHTQILVTANETVLRSQTIETYNKANKSEVLNEGIWESIIFINDNGITKFIAENNESTIKVRFQGTQYYDDKVLKNKIKQNIKYAYELSEMIKQRTELLQL